MYSPSTRISDLETALQSLLDCFDLDSDHYTIETIDDGLAVVSQDIETCIDEASAVLNSDGYEEED